MQAMNGDLFRASTLGELDADKVRRPGGCSMTRPCECGLVLRPWRLCGFRMEPADGAPSSVVGSCTQGRHGLPSADSLAGSAPAGN